MSTGIETTSKAMQSLDLSRIVGPIVVATIITTALWGMTVMQALMYFATYESDHWYLKSLVLFLCFLNTLHEILSVQAVWYTLIPNFGDPSILLKIPQEYFDQIIVTALIAVLAQGFFLWRVWCFSAKKGVLLVILVPFIVVQMVGFILYSALGNNKSLQFILSPLMSRLCLGASSLVAVIDIVISVMMCILLWRDRTGIPSSDRMIIRLINASMSTGSCTAVFASIMAVTVAAFPRDTFFTLGEVPLAALYCNAVLANLNSRKYIKISGSNAITSYTNRVPSSMHFGLSALESVNENEGDT